MSVPPLLLSLTLVTALGVGTGQIAVAIGATSVAAFTRVMRAEVLRVRAAPYVEAAILCGARWWRILPRYILPSAFGPVLALAALDFGLVVLAVSSLGFLGYGEPPPAPEWGSLVADGRNYLATARRRPLCPISRSRSSSSRRTGCHGCSKRKGHRESGEPVRDHDSAGGIQVGRVR
ncbi:hypothetical protein STENM36S_09321 [Streptomyces tendae]